VERYKKKILYSRDVIGERVKALAGQVSRDFSGKDLVVVGVLKGSFMFMADLMRRLSLPALIVARSTLGTINHTLLTLEALRARAIGIAGVVMVGPFDRDNREAIESFGQVPVVGELPVLDPLTPGAVAAWAIDGMDPEGRLAGCLQ